MKKIAVKTKKEDVVIETTPTTETVIKIMPFSGDFGREDINLLRDKVNEIINFINK